MNITRSFLFIALVAPIFTVFADDSSPEIPAVDRTKWKCGYCVVLEGWSGDVELGIGNVTDNAYKFGEYTGLNEKGAFLVSDANLTYRNPDATYLNLSISDFSLDSRSLSVKGGKQGSYKFFLTYDEIPHLISDSGVTPFIGSGSASLTLPPAWVPAATTGSMSGLAGNLNTVELGTQRKRVAYGISFSPESPWGYAVKARQETKQGNKRVSGTFSFSSAQLIEPVDYLTDEVDVALTYSADKLQARLSYYGSIFENQNESLTWQNPYTALSGNNSGQLALAPDNQFHQLLFTAGYALNDATRVSGDIAIGRMEQNEAFLDATQNLTIAVPAQPANSANAQVDTLDAKVKVVSTLTDKLRLNASFAYHDRDNKTPQLDFNWVTTDISLNPTRTNLPYSFTQSAVKLSADYKLKKGIKLGAGYDYDIDERTFQEIEKTTEDTIWGRVRIRSIEKLVLELKLSQSARDISIFQPVAEIQPAQNVLLRKYNMAGKESNKIGLSANISPAQSYTIGLNIDVSQDDYVESTLGLTQSDSFSFNGDISAMLLEETSVHFFYGRENIKSTQLGSGWSAKNNDIVNNLGVGFTHVLIEDKLDIGADYIMTNSTGEISVISGALTEFPNLTTDLHTVKLFANYHLEETLTLRAAYLFESYDSEDWAVENVSPTTISNVLSLGELTPSYKVNVIKVSMAYQF